MSILQWFRQKFVPGDHSPLPHSFDHYEIGDIDVKKFDDSESETCSVQIDFTAGDILIEMGGVFKNKGSVVVNSDNVYRARYLARKICKFLNEDAKIRDRYSLTVSTNSDSIR